MGEQFITTCLTFLEASGYVRGRKDGNPTQRGAFEIRSVKYSTYERGNHTLYEVWLVVPK